VRRHTRLAWVFILLAIAAPLHAGLDQENSPSPESASESDSFVPPADLGEGWYARIDTSKGRIVIRLFPDQAPQSVAHFVGLAEGSLSWVDPVDGVTHTEPYYDGVRIHLAEVGSRFEAGDRTGTGRGAPIMYVPPEGFGPVNFFGDYRVGMTRASGGRISAVQFFITVAAQRHYNGRHPCFGEVVEGERVVFDITSVKTFSNGRPVEPVVIERIRPFTVGQPAPLAEPRAHQPRPPKFGLNEYQLRKQRERSPQKSKDD